jgi:hypothetical protein
MEAVSIHPGNVPGGIASDWESTCGEHNPALRSGLKVWALNLGVLGQRT